jgi:mannose-1-phosphate guanylyltransferase
MGLSAILLVGGFGTRLHPLTKERPKPMLHVAGVPFIEHQICRARDAGVSEIVLATAFMAEIFKPHFGEGERMGISIKYAIEEQPLGTGGAIRNASELLTGDGPVVIYNGDVLSDHDLSRQIAFHQEMSAQVTLYLTEVEDARAFGSVELSDSGRVLAFNEKMEHPTSNIINAGCYIFDRTVFSTIPLGETVSVERETFPMLLNSGANVFGFVDRSYWLDIGTPKALVQASHDLVTGRIRSSATPTHEGEILIQAGAVIEAEARVRNGTVVGSGSYVLEGCIIDNCILGSDVVVGAHSVLRNCIVADRTHLPSGTLAESSYLGFA